MKATIDQSGNYLILRSICIPEAVDSKLRSMAFKKKTSFDEVVRKILRKALKDRDVQARKKK
ncbi:MAG: hypothetical protein AAB389_01640 [Patescibacteria group bacterium]